MAEEQQEVNDQVQFLLNDFSTRLRDIDERNRLIRERVLLLGKNLVDSREDLSETLNEIKKDNREIKKELERLNKLSKNLLTEFGKFVKRDEIVLVERMLKDFQPLEFARIKDVEELIDRRLKPVSPKIVKPIAEPVSKKQIKTAKTNIIKRGGKPRRKIEDLL